MQIVELLVSEVFADPDFNCRGEIAPIDVVDLARDIQNHGLQNPIQVQEFTEKVPYKFRIIAGHRRHKAFIVLEKEYIPCIISEGLSFSQALILNIGENLNRKDLNILQEAKALSKLKLAGLGELDVCRELGASRGWVQIRYMLLELPHDIQQEAGDGTIKQTQIRELYSIRFDKAELYNAVRNLKNAKLRGETFNIKKQKKNPLTKKCRDKAEMNEMMDHIQEFIGNSFGTRCLAWASGEITNWDLYKDIKEIAEEEDKFYELPNLEMNK